MQQAGGYTDEQMDVAFKAILDDATRAIMGEITAEMLDMKLKGMNYDVDVAEAEHLGEVRGKNTTIEAKKKALQGSADVPPMIEGKSGGVSGGEQYIDPKVEKIRQMSKRPDVWKGMVRRTE